MGYSIDDIYPSKYLKSIHLDDDEEVILTIQEVVPETFGRGPKAEDKLVIYSAEAKPLPLNITNVTIIGKMYGGKNTDGWIGKQITIYTVEEKAFGEVQRLIRVRPKPPRPQGGNPPQRPAPRPDASAQGGQQAPSAADEVEILNGPMDPATRAAIVEAARVYWGPEKAAAGLREYLEPKTLNKLSEGVARKTLEELKKRAGDALNPKAAAKAAKAAVPPEDDFDDKDPFADTY